ncbi:DUF937 domain-containing protein [Neolewinella lacunae]|uniref:DUF937 domain-containing protein n=1 Tax=Neolewinella lacunae TaxID=1517758 RepID=A0A923TD33_9BACT|nr:DUF937 domain-containing protein [Neolewinella lacunae]MBC6994392.1 DUF937 domain-containing protein [Neolewinella lacunae]MDN3633323.1 DUF937 domain-containing protein [Neolewinella lacunae]
MDLTQLLQQQLSQQLTGGFIDQISNQLGGVDKRQTATATSAILSTLMGALARNASTPDGAAALSNALEKDHDGSLLDNLGGLLGGASGGGQAGGLGGLLGSVLSSAASGNRGGAGGGLGGMLGGLLGGAMGGGQGQQPEIPPQFRRTLNGGGILDHILGEQKEQTMQEVSKTSGLSLDKIGPLMTILAPIVMGMLGKTKREAGLDASGLGGLLTDFMLKPGATNPSTGTSSGGGFLGNVAGQLLDQNGDGSAVDDIIGMGTKMLGGFFKR